MTDQLKKFLKEANHDETFLKKMEMLQGETDRAKVVEQTVAIAKDMGFALTAADFEAEEGEIDDLELQAVSGGWTKCVCVAGGGGTEDNDGDVCACVVVGLGMRKDNGHERCGCPLIGYGYDYDRESCRELGK